MPKVIKVKGKTVTIQGVTLQQVGPNRFRKQYRDPVTGERDSIYGTDPEDLIARYTRVIQLRHDYKAGAISDPHTLVAVRNAAKGPLSLREMWETYIATVDDHWGKAARSYWRLHVFPEFRDCRAVELDASKLAKWEKELQRKPLAQTTIGNIYAVLQAAANMAIEDGRLAELPWRGWRPERPTEKQRTIPHNEDALFAILTEAKRRDLSELAIPRYADLAARCAVIAAFGLRQAEGSGLGNHDIQPGAKTPFVLRIRRQAVDQWPTRFPGAMEPPSLPKSKRSRTIPLSDAGERLLRAQQAVLARFGRFAPHGPLFPAHRSPGPAWRTHADLVKPEVLRALATRAGLPYADELVTHALRHFFGTAESRQRPLTEVRDLMGHHALEVTEVYLHTPGEAMAPPVLQIPAGYVPGGERVVLAGRRGELNFAGVAPGAGEEDDDPPDVDLQEELARVALEPARVRTIVDLVCPTTAEEDGARAEREDRRKQIVQKSRSKGASGFESMERAAADWNPRTHKRPPAVTAYAEESRRRAYADHYYGAQNAKRNGWKTRSSVDLQGFVKLMAGEKRPPFVREMRKRLERVLAGDGEQLTQKELETLAKIVAREKGRRAFAGVLANWTRFYKGYGARAPKELPAQIVPVVAANEPQEVEE
ncbi:tyrosine-type recombinase/integrase [Polyangium fumosum]|uniref:Tyr recombinase domain-containing protein n=1 Tax=Polyangium fumosum TaxID=889272 RepID=A0A4U1J0J6_9BACT|nr:site-specific integrase [Polyangium fumosum]TKD00420.1 hypothetical protein E8A74_34570 [Polyangium fumosum]